MKIYSIDLYVKEVKTKDGKNTFNSYHTYDKKGKILSVRFKRDIKVLPDKNGVIDIVKGNVSKAGKYPVLWVEEYANYHDFPEKEDNLAEFFDSDEENN